MRLNRRTLLRNVASAAATGLGAAAGIAAAAPTIPTPPGRPLRIGVISSRILGKVQRLNGHTWHFAQYFHPECNLEAVRKYKDPGTVRLFQNYLRNPQTSFHRWPFPNTVIASYYEPDAEAARIFCEAFPGVEPASSLDQMAREVDAVWLGDASGFGEDHFDLIAPALERGLPTFCDKPIGGSVAETRKILEFASQHGAPLMSSSIYRYQWGTEEALRMKASDEFGPLQFVLASQAGDHSPERWRIYGQHPAWMVMTLCGAGVDGVSFSSYRQTAHVMVSYPDRYPAEIWCGRPDARSEYCSTSVYFSKKAYTYTPAIEGHYWLGHHYQMLNMADTFRKMITTREEPVPHREILEVTAMIHAGIKSETERGRFVQLGEVL